MTSEQILAILDQAAQDATFPMFDNGYVYPAAARLTLHRSATDWGVVFETFGYSPRVGQPDCAITTFASSLANRKPAKAFYSAEAHAEYLTKNPHFEQRFVFPIEEDGLYEEDSPDFLSPDATHLVLRGRQFPLPGCAALRAAGILPEEDRPLIFEVARYLARHHRDLVLATEAERIVNLPEGVEQVAVFDDWHHPDIARDEWPSETRSFREIAALLAGEPHDAAGITSRSNTHWSYWPEGGRL